MLDRIISSFTQLGYQFLDVIPNLIAAIVIIIVGNLVAKFISKGIGRMLRSLKIDSLGDKINDIDVVQKSNFNFVLSQIISKIFYYVLFLMFAMVAAEVLEFKAVSDLFNDIFDFIPKVIAACIVLAIGLVIADLLKTLVNTTTKSLGIPSASLIGSFVFYFILLMTVVTALTQIGIDTDFISNNLTVLLGGAVFAFGLGYGLASKDTMANFLASFYSKDKFKLGNKIKIENVSGEIVEMDNSTMTILGVDNQKIIIPLSKLTTEKVEIID